MENKKVIRILSGILANAENKKKLMDVMRIADINSENYHEILTRSIETMGLVGLLDLADIDSKTSAAFRNGIFNAKKNAYAPSVNVDVLDRVLCELRRNPEYVPIAVVTAKSGSTGFNSVTRIDQFMKGEIDIHLYELCASVTTEPVKLVVQEGFFENGEKENYLYMELDSDMFHSQLEINREAQSIVNSKIQYMMNTYIDFRKEFLCFN